MVTCMALHRCGVQGGEAQQVGVHLEVGQAADQLQLRHAPSRRRQAELSGGHAVHPAPPGSPFAKAEPGVEGSDGEDRNAEHEDAPFVYSRVVGGFQTHIF
jgi:hypothetical protein